MARKFSTKIYSIKKYGKKLNNCNKVMELIQAIEALDSIREEVPKEDEEHLRKHEEKNGNSRGRSVATTSIATIVNSTTNHTRAEPIMETRATNHADVLGMTITCKTAPTTHATRISKRRIKRPRTTSPNKKQT